MAAPRGRRISSPTATAAETPDTETETDADGVMTVSDVLAGRYRFVRGE
ncbi:hypothetical protein [Sphaerisporangium perillae]|nr:hypothetical protein [Sphaerisporangium perillae]